MSDLAKEYLGSHPFISYRLDMSKAPASLWLALGQAQSHCQDLLGIPIRPDVSRRLHEVYMAKGVAATTAIEGNTLTEDQVATVMKGNQLELPGSFEYQQQEVRNVIDTYNWIFDNWSTCSVISPELILEIHRRVLNELDLTDEVTAGQYRNHSVTVGTYRGAPARDVPHLVRRLCDWLNSSQFDSPNEDMKMAYAIVRAIVAHVYIAWIHPFGDGNGRTARTVEFQLLIAAGLPKPASHLLSQHYSRTRMHYYHQLDRSHKSGGDLFPFIGYALDGLVGGLQEQMLAIRAEQQKVAWEHYVHSILDEKSETVRRRKKLVLEISKLDEPVDIDEIPHLSADLRKMYRDKTLKTVTRDVNALGVLGLLIQRQGRVSPNLSLVRAFIMADPSPAEL